MNILVIVATERIMSYWDKLPNELKHEVFKARAAKTIQNNWRRHPAIRSCYLASGVMSGEYGIEIACPHTAGALEYCAKYSGKGNTGFWANFCLELLYKLIECQYSSDHGHGWTDRCEAALKILVNKYSSEWCDEYNRTLRDTVNAIAVEEAYLI